jgi:hypothetical protein
MKIFIHGRLDTEYKDFVWNSGDHYLLSLYGIGIDARNESDVYVEPIYTPRITINRESGTLITIRIWKLLYWNFLFMEIYPYFKFYKTDAVRLDIEEDE